MNKLLTGKKLTKALDTAVRELFKVMYGPNPTCFVCGTHTQWWNHKTCPRGIQVGHYIARGCTKLRWNLKNLFPQCSGDNIYHNTNPAPFTMAIIKAYGVERIEFLEKTAREAKGNKMSNLEKRELLEDFQYQIDKLIK